MALDSSPVEGYPKEGGPQPEKKKLKVLDKSQTLLWGSLLEESRKNKDKNRPPRALELKQAPFNTSQA